MTRFLNYLLSFLMVTFSALSCAKQVEKPKENIIERKDIPLTKTQQAYVQANNQFAFNLLKEVYKEANATSFIVSPLSVSYAMGMLNNGAQGNTLDQINSALGYKDDGLLALNEFSKYLMEQTAKVDPSTKVDIANAVVSNKDLLSLKEKFVSDVTNYYNAEVTGMSFSKDDVLGHINGWCKNKTQGMIPKILDGVDQSALVYLLNAIYFKGIWLSKFDPNLTKDESFTKEDGSVANVKMMRKRSKFMLSANDVYESLCLPYGNGAYNMMVLLPTEGHKVQDIVNSLNYDSWKDNLSKLNSYEVDIKLPKFETSYEIELNNALMSLGVEDAFDSKKADFKAMSDNAGFINRVFQKAKIKLDEEGTEASAVTVIGMVTSIGPGGVFYFHADRPFLYAITEVSTGAVFFLGQYQGD